MTVRLRHLWEQARSSVLFLPGAITLGAIVLAVGLVEVDRRVDRELIDAVPWLFAGGPDGARAVLSVIATSMATLAGVTFSVTIVALALQSQQFGPRLLRNFTSDASNQFVLGTFVATVVYCLLVLRSTRESPDEDLVPYLAVTVGLLLALVSLGLFIFFIDRVVNSIQVTTIIADAADDTASSLDKLFPELLGEDGGDGTDLDDVMPHAIVAVTAKKSGYIQTLDAGKLMGLASESDVVLRMELPIGGFAAEGTPMLSVGPRERVSDELAERLRRAYQVGRHRSITEDPEFGIRQIVDVAVKALSPSMNDPTTAITSLDYLGALLSNLARRSIPARIRRDGDGRPRVIARGPTFENVAGLAFNQIRQYATSDVAVTMALLRTIERVATHVSTDVRRDVLERHVRKIARGADAGIEDPDDRADVNRALHRAMEALKRPGAFESNRLEPNITASG